MIKQVINQEKTITDKACCRRTWVLEFKVKQLPVSNASISQYNKVSNKGIGVQEAWTPLFPTPPPQIRLSNIFLFSPPLLFCSA